MHVGKTNKLFIVQARPETVHSQAKRNIIRTYSLKVWWLVPDPDTIPDVSYMCRTL